jgi:NAD(P)-dependent dehydrogenase (short-subunit alcohol dehydrogenase family)
MNILLTGASRGIGAATCELLKSKGHNVVGHCTRGGDDALAGDLADPAAPRRIWEEAVERFGHVDALVNNAGIYEAIGTDASDADWQAAWNRTLTVI